MSRQRVKVKVWGLTRRDVQRGRDDLRVTEKLRLVDVVNVEELVGGPCPIPRRDENAYAQEAEFGRAWVAYEEKADPQSPQRSGGTGYFAPDEEG
jgi:hypothetical protein